MKIKINSNHIISKVTLSNKKRKALTKRVQAVELRGGLPKKPKFNHFFSKFSTPNIVKRTPIKA